MITRLLSTIRPIYHGLFSNGKVFYIIASMLIALTLIITLAIMLFTKPSTKTSNLLKGRLLTALWTCLGLMVLIALSSWQGLPLIGTPSAFWIVVLILTAWLYGLWLYRLISVPKKLAQERRSATYVAYLPRRNSQSRFQNARE